MALSKATIKHVIPLGVEPRTIIIIVLLLIIIIIFSTTTSSSRSSSISIVLCQLV